LENRACTSVKVPTSVNLTTAIAPFANSFVPADADIFNFALHLEYLEAQYYHVSRPETIAATFADFQKQIAAFGTQLDQSLLSGTGTQGQVQTSQTTAVPFSSNLTKAFAQEIATDELNHVKVRLLSAYSNDLIASTRPSALPLAPLLTPCRLST
jgi:hypothetical protein